MRASADVRPVAGLSGVHAGWRGFNPQCCTLNQATEYHLGQLKARLAKLRTELQAPATKVRETLNPLET